MYKDLTTRNRSALKRFSHQQRFDVAIELLGLNDADTFLDYGTGDGHLLVLLNQRGIRPRRTFGFEPFPLNFKELQQTAESGFGSEVEISETPPDGASCFSKISCLEVLEHMPAERQRSLLGKMKSLMSRDGLLVVSVPIEIGLGGLLKNFARIVLGQTHEGTTSRNLLRSAFGLNVERPKGSYVSSHIGFDYRELEPLFDEAGLQVVRRVCSPFPWLGAMCNSQICYLLRPA